MLVVGEIEPLLDLDIESLPWLREKVVEYCIFSVRHIADLSLADLEQKSNRDAGRSSRLGSEHH